MLRYTLCAVGLFAVGSVTRADELDRETPGAKVPVVKASMQTAPGTEMDQESPDAAHRYRGGWGGGYRGYHGGYGYRGGYGHHGWNGGWGGHYGRYYGGGWNYRPYYAGFYRPYYGTSITIGYSGYGYGTPWY